MQILILFLICSTFSGYLSLQGKAIAQNIFNENHAESIQMFITGGYRPLQHTLSKHLVSIRTARPTEYFGDNHFCAGTIVGPRAILTAAHCVMDSNKIITRPRRLTVIAGAPNRLRKDNTTVELFVDMVIPHSKFIRRGRHDIAMLLLKRPIPVDNDAIAAIALANRSTNFGSNCITLGWGQLFYNGPYSAEAIYLTLTILNNAACYRYYPNWFEESMICAGDESDWDKNACNGDSGGPIICDGKLAGITSWGLRCGQPGYPSVFTDVYKHREWIRQINAAVATKYIENFSLLTVMIALIKVVD